MAYGEALLELGRQRPEIVVLDADLYNSTRTVLFKDEFPERFVDVGISEADMVSTAAGMAACGLIPYCQQLCHVFHHDLLPADPHPDRLPSLARSSWSVPASG